MNPSAKPVAATSTETMLKGRQADSKRRRDRVTKAITDAVAVGGEISVTAIAARARVDRSFLYRHRDLLAEIHAAETHPSPAGTNNAAVSRESLRADLLAAQQRCLRMAAHTHQLEKRLAELLGQQAWQQSGLGAPTDIEALQRRIIELEQQSVDLRIQLETRDEELAAARAANRDLMTQINSPTRLK